MRPMAVSAGTRSDAGGGIEDALLEAGDQVDLGDAVEADAARREQVGGVVDLRIVARRGGRPWRARARRVAGRCCRPRGRRRTPGRGTRRWRRRRPRSRLRARGRAGGGRRPRGRCGSPRGRRRCSSSRSWWRRLRDWTRRRGRPSSGGRRPGTCRRARETQTRVGSDRSASRATSAMREAALAWKAAWSR